jgi:hypothetical protein
MRNRLGLMTVDPNSSESAPTASFKSINDIAIPRKM